MDQTPLTRLLEEYRVPLDAKQEILSLFIKVVSKCVKDDETLTRFYKEIKRL